MSGAAAAPVPAKAPAQTLDEVMVAMDVVDTIRHRELLVERELGQADRDDALRNRLREIYQSQGLEVSDAAIDQGIKALKESRFVYTPPAPGVGVFLATLWVRRGGIGKVLVALVVAGFIGWAGFYFLVESPRQLAVEAARIEFTDTLPNALTQARAQILAEAKVEPARVQAQQLYADGTAAVAAHDREGVQAALTGFETLHAKLAQTYDLRVVSRDDEDTGVYRIPDVNSGARNYYIIVEAVGAGGNRIKMNITSEESGKTKRVSRWGIRVPEATYEAVKADKLDDGIVENNLLGQKLRGEIEPRYAMPVTGGAILKW